MKEIEEYVHNSISYEIRTHIKVLVILGGGLDQSVTYKDGTTGEDGEGQESEGVNKDDDIQDR